LQRSLKCWGRNSEGELGLDVNTTHLGTQPGQMGDALPAVDLGTGVHATQVSVGQFFTCALLSSQTVKCWGYGANGQLGNDNNVTVGMGAYGPSMGDHLPVVAISGVITDVASGQAHSCVIRAGDVLCFGFNFFGQLGNGDNLARGCGYLCPSPFDMASLQPVALGGQTAVALAAGYGTTVALLANGSVAVWGVVSPSYQVALLPVLMDIGAPTPAPSSAPTSAAPTRTPLSKQPSASPATAQPSKSPAKAGVHSGASQASALLAGHVLAIIMFKP